MFKKINTVILKEGRRSVSRVLSCMKTYMYDHSSSPIVTNRLKQPTRAVTQEHACDQSHTCYYLVLLPVGFTDAASVTRSAVCSYHTIAPLPDKSGGIFLWHYP